MRHLGRLPSPGNLFIPRPPLIERIERGLTSQRLVTLHGPPGIGKTRLALELARTTDAYDRVVETSLTDARSADQVADAVLMSIQRRDLSAIERQARVRSVADWCADRGRVLLVLDDAERCVAGLASCIGVWLDAARGLDVIITSTVALSIPSEVCIPVPELDLDEGGALLRARLVELDVDGRIEVPGAAELHALTRILDGHPLALELAAGRLLHQRVDELTRALRQHREILEPRRDLRATRRNSITVALDEVWRGLTAREAHTLMHSSVFEDSFDLPALGALVAADDARDWLPDVVHRLVDRSLLQVADQPGVRGRRFRLLGLVRRYARGRLQADPCLTETAYRRRERTCVARARRWCESVLGPADFASVAAIRAELPNLRSVRDALSARRRDLGPGAELDAEVGEALVWVVLAIDAALERFAPGPARLENLAYLEPVLTCAIDGRALVFAHFAKSRAYVSMSDARGAALAQRCVAVAERSGQALLCAAACLAMSYASYGRGAMESALAEADRGLALLAWTTDESAGHARLDDSEPERLRVVGRLLVYRGAVLHWMHGPTDTTVAATRQAWRCFEQVGDVFNAADAARMLAPVLVDLGRVDETRELVLEQLERRSPTGYRYVSGLINNALAWALAETGEAVAARDVMLQAARASRYGGMRHAEPVFLAYAGSFDIEAGRYHDAVERLRDAVDLASGVDHPVARRTEWLGGCYLRVASVLADAPLEAELSVDRDGPHVEDEATRAAGRALYDLADIASGVELEPLEALRARLLGDTPAGAPLVGGERRQALRMIEHVRAWMLARRRRMVVRSRGREVELGTGVSLDLRRHPLVRRLLDRLLEGHRCAPGSPVSTRELIESAWPGEDLGDLGPGRVYVAMARMRKLGFDEHLRSSRAGYWLDADVEIAD